MNTLPRYNRPTALAWLIAGTLAAALWLAGDAVAVEGVIGDLQHAGNQARGRDGAVLLVFRADDCPYCRLLENEVLLPWQLSDDFDPRILVQQVDVDAPRIADFDGQLLSGQQVADRYRVQVTPTVVVVDGHGRSLAEPLVGIASVDFYPAYLDATIVRALAQVNR